MDVNRPTKEQQFINFIQKDFQQKRKLLDEIESLKKLKINELWDLDNERINYRVEKTLGAQEHAPRKILRI